MSLSCCNLGHRYCRRDASLRAQESEEGKKELPKTSQAWTLAEARQAMRSQPDDAYLQYVALQLASQEGKTAEVVREIEGRHNRWSERPANRRADLFDMFTGALAVQESLQLDAFRHPAARPGAAVPEEESGDVNVADLKGSLIRSHPWGKMLAAQTLAGKKAEVSPLSLCVPEDQYYVEFRSLGKLLEATEAGDLWGDHLFTQAAKSAQIARRQRTPQGPTGHEDRSALAAVLRHGRQRSRPDRQRPLLPRGDRRHHAFCA